MFDYPLFLPGSTSYAELGIGPDATAQDIVDAKIELIRELKAKEGDGETSIEIKRRLEALNGMPILNPADRVAYDAANPPLELLKVESSRPDTFATDPTLILPLVRRELAQLFADHGEEVFHPSDLTRTDFSGDFSYCRILDGGSR